jgi:hypothetical protein
MRRPVSGGMRVLYGQRESLHGFTELLDSDRVIGQEQNSSNERG